MQIGVTGRRRLAAALTLAVAVAAGSGLMTAASPQPAQSATGGPGPLVRLLAKDSGQSVTAVLTLKQQDGTWPAVVAALKLSPATVRGQLAAIRRARVRAAVAVAVLAKLSGRTPAEVRALRRPGVAWSQVAAQLGINWKAVLPQVRARLRARAAALVRAAVAVAVLAKLSGRTPAEVRALRKPGVTWSQVAAQLGLNWKTVLPQVRQRTAARIDARIRSAAVVGLLAGLSGRTPAQVRALKQKGMTWVDVAHALGIR